MRTLSRTIGPTMSPFDSYLTMRGIKTMPLRWSGNARMLARVASWLANHPQVERVYFTGDPKHPDAATIARLFPKNLQGAMLAFDLKGAGKAEVFRFMEALKMIVPANIAGRCAYDGALSGNVIAPRIVGEDAAPGSASAKD